MFFFSNFCILCFNTANNHRNILNEDGEEIPFEKKLKDCLPEIVDSHLKFPKYICNNCINNVDNFYKFKQMCLRHNTNLKNYLQTLTPGDETYKQLSVRLTDIQHQNKPQQTLPNVGSEHELRTGRKEDNGICIKEETNFQIEINCADVLDIQESDSLFDEKEDINFEEVCLKSDNHTDIEFYNEFEKSPKCELIESNSVSDNADLHSQNISGNIPINPGQKKVTVKNEFKKTIYQCVICNKEYLYKEALKYHLQAHSTVKTFECATCNKKVKCKRSLIRHNINHTGIKNYECLICKKKFAHKRILTEHENIHTGAEKYECNVCNKSFNNKSNLRKHENIHIGIRRFQCSVCKKKFLAKQALDVHEKIHTGVKDFQCTVCNKKFIDKNHLNRHEKIHARNKNV